MLEPIVDAIHELDDGLLHELKDSPQGLQQGFQFIHEILENPSNIYPSYISFWDVSIGQNDHSNHNINND